MDQDNDEFLKILQEQGHQRLDWRDRAANKKTGCSNAIEATAIGLALLTWLITTLWQFFLQAASTFN